MTYGTLTIDNQIYMDGDAIDADLFDAIARDNGGARGLAEFRDRVTLRPVAFTICTSDNPAPVRLGCWEGFLRYVFTHRVDVLYVYSGEQDFSTLDWAIHRDAGRGWERTSKQEQRDENGKYQQVQGWKYAELSGDSGQRYYFALWQQRKDKKRRLVTRGCQFYALANIFTKGEKELFQSFDASGTSRCEKLFDSLVKFDKLCARELHFSFIQKGGKPLAMTAGTLARIELFRNMYGDNLPKTNAQIFKRNHRTEKGVGAYFRKLRLFRGGICCGAFDSWGQTLTTREDGATLKKYDVNSEYSHVARTMPDLAAPEMCDDLGELFNRRAGYTYIAVFSRLQATRKRGMPAVFVNPFNGASTSININQHFAIFADELDELRNFYTFGECDVVAVFRLREHSRGVFAPFVDMWYGKKLSAKKDGDAGLYTLAKMINNSAWGQLGKRSRFPVVVHEYNTNTGLIELKEVEPADEDEDDGAYSFVLGARVPSLARIYIMQRIRKYCGDANALASFLYADTDSLTTYADLPAEDVSDERLGAFKLETIAQEAVFLSKKLYYTIERFSPLKIDIHARGINAESIIQTLLNNYGADNVSELPREAFSQAFTARGARFSTPATLNVDGGRLRFYVDKALTLDNVRKIKYKSVGGVVFGIDENGDLYEI